jgi:NADPH:quinone reductase
VIEDGGTSGLARGSRVAFTGGYGVAENGSWQDYVAVRTDDLLPVPVGIDDVPAASLPVAYLTAQIALDDAGFTPGKTVFTPAIGGSVGNATYQLAKALGAAAVISTAGSAAKAKQARDHGYADIIDLRSPASLIREHDGLCGVLYLNRLGQRWGDTSQPDLASAYDAARGN